MSNKMFCKNCGAKWGNSKTCKVCGSKINISLIYITENVFIYEKLRLKQKRKGNKRPISELVMGNDLYRKNNTWMNLTRIFNHLENKYEEIILDLKTGKITAYVNEKLSDHIGHVLDKKK